MPLQLGFDNKLKNYLSSQGENPDSFLLQISNLASIYLKDPQGPGLPSKIEWDIRPNILFVQDLNICSDELCEHSPRRNGTKIVAMMRKRLGNSVPLMMFSEDLVNDEDFIETYLGCAGLGTACGHITGGNWGVVDLTTHNYPLYSHKLEMARTMAHEFGHMVRYSTQGVYFIIML